jgi:fumarylpyruvate hydrolase
MGLVFSSVGVPSVAIEGSSDLYPARRIYCIGQNYAEHAREMGYNPDREPPCFFMKPADSLLPTGEDFPYPAATNDVHHEIELVVALGKEGKDIEEGDALDYIYGYAVGLDMTRRDLQGEAKKASFPWETGKAFDNCAPIAPIVPASKIGHPTDGRIWLEVNGEARQEGDINQLIWDIPETISFLSKQYTLMPGDLIFTGTPAGVGPINKGDVIVGGIEGVGTIKTPVV